MKKKNKIWVYIFMFFSLFAGALAWALMPGEKEIKEESYPGPGTKKTVKISPKAEKLLKEMSRSLSDLKNFSLSSQGYLEVIPDSLGQKIQLNNIGLVYASRPDKLRAERTGELSDVIMYYNTDSFTVYGKNHNMYASIATPDNIDETIDFLRERVDVHLPGTDLLYSDVYSALTEDVVSGAYIGQSMAGNVLCDHLAFKGNEVDWQIWIEATSRKLPRKYVITSKNMEGAPTFSTEITEWNTDPVIDDGMFTFNPPAGAKEIDFLTIESIQAKTNEKK